MQSAYFSAIITIFISSSARVFAQTDSTSPPPLVQMQQEADSLKGHVSSKLAKDFLAAVKDLPSITEKRVLYYNRQTRDAISSKEYEARGLDTTSGYSKRELGEDFYYFTRYGTPVAYVRPFDLLAQAGLKSVDGAKIIDFGFGGIGQLRMLARLGADVTGIEVDAVSKVFYTDPHDTGIIARSSVADKGKDGHLRLLFGFYPTDTVLTSQLGRGYDLFISKNTLKRGYIHPTKEVDPKMLVHLGVDDSTFVARVYDLLNPGGYFMIYNLHPAESKEGEPYKPWADGRSPFTKELYEKIGFKVLAFDVDDTEYARKMGKLLGWDADMDLANDLFGTYTLVRKP